MLYKVLLLAVLWLLKSATAVILPQPISSEQSPAGNPLAYALAPPAGLATSGACNVAIAADNLVYTNAEIVHQTAGHIDCTSQLLVSSIPEGYRFSITNVSVSGYLSLEKGCYLEKVQVSLLYPASENQTPQPDIATAKNAFGKYGVGYEGNLGLIIPVKAGSSALASSSCTSSTSLAVELFVSLVHEQLVPDDAIPHYGSVGGDTPDRQLKLSFDADWFKC